MGAIVMAAGEGVRLRPLTARWAKPVLPIDGRPVVATLVRELCDAGFEQVTIVVGHLAEQVQALLGDGSGFGLELRYVDQPRPEGSGDAVRRALAAGAAAPTLVVGADTVFAAGDVGRFAGAAAEADGAIAVRRRPAPSIPHRAPVRIVAGRVERVVDDDPDNPLGSAPLWWMGTRLAPLLEGLTGPPYELAEAFQLAVDTGLDVRGVEIGRTRDLTYPVDLVEENFPYLGSA